MTVDTAEVNFKAEVTCYSVSFGPRESLGSTFGPQTHKMADGDSEEVAIRDYFKKGFTYDEILALLDKYHGVRMSIAGIATLKRRLKEYGLKRRNVDYDMVSVRDKIRGLLDGPDCMGGYRHIWHTLKMQGIGVPRSAVEALLRELDPEGTEERRAHRLRRRAYRNNGPNDTWHCDGYDKLKPFGFPIHACIDGSWSRKVLWLYVTRSNNWPHNIATYYLDAVEHQGGCPQKLITDLGTENGLMASIHSFFRDDLSSHHYNRLHHSFFINVSLFNLFHVLHI